MVVLLCLFGVGKGILYAKQLNLLMSVGKKILFSDQVDITESLQMEFLFLRLRWWLPPLLLKFNAVMKSKLKINIVI